MWLISGTSLTVFLFFEQLAFVCHSVALILCVISSCLNICIYAIEVLCTLSILHIFFSFIFLFFFFSYLITWLCSCRFFFPSFISPTQTLFLSLQLSPPPCSLFCSPCSHCCSWETLSDLFHVLVTSLPPCGVLSRLRAPHCQFDGTLQSASWMSWGRLFSLIKIKLKWYLMGPSVDNIGKSVKR